MKFYLFYFCLLLLMPIACSSNGEKEPMTSTTQLLTDSTWTGIRNFEDIDLNGTFEEFGDNCEKDDPWTFLTNGTLEQRYGPILCDPDEDDPNTVITSDWTLQNSDQYLVIEYPFDEVTFLIVSARERELVLNVVDVDNPGVYTHRVVLSR